MLNAFIGNIWNLCSWMKMVNKLSVLIPTLLFALMSNSGGKPKHVRFTNVPFQKGDIIGCALDLTVPQIVFSVNGVKVPGFFKDFNTDGMFFPVVTLSAGVRYVNECKT